MFWAFWMLSISGCIHLTMNWAAAAAALWLAEITDAWGKSLWSLLELLEPSLARKCDGRGWKLGALNTEPELCPPWLCTLYSCLEIVEILALELASRCMVTDTFYGFVLFLVEIACCMLGGRPNMALNLFAWLIPLSLGREVDLAYCWPPAEELI